jgi:hypothetical protein
MSDSEFLNSSLLDIIIPSKKNHIFIRNLCDVTLKIIFNAWWRSMNVGSRCPISSNYSRHAPSWGLNLDHGIEETGIPGIICIVCYQVLDHPSEYGTSSMGKHLLGNAHIAKLNEFSEAEVTELPSPMDNTTALASLKKQGSQEITVLSSQRKILFDIRLDPC